MEIFGSESGKTDEEVIKIIEEHSHNLDEGLDPPSVTGFLFQ